MLKNCFLSIQAGSKYKRFQRIFLDTKQKLNLHPLSYVRSIFILAISAVAIYLTFIWLKGLKTVGIKNETIDWHDYSFIEMEKRRTGLGESGVEAQLLNDDVSESLDLYAIYGYNAYLSEKISMQRSILDTRPKMCWKQKYLSELPSTSIIIIFFNEHLQTLLRTVHSIANRTPTQLIQEIILVDDASSLEQLGTPLDEYVEENFQKVSIIRLKQRSGLIRARLAGAKKATGEVLLFLDAHCEVNVNWLPPLIDPIARNEKTVMCPLIDAIHSETFKYDHQDKDGKRGAFNWDFDYKRLDRLPSDVLLWKNFKSPIMSGGLFAISAKFFWHLGGYDEGLQIWGGEQYELSFKIWMCGGEMYDSPCSRVGHVYRDFSPSSDDTLKDYQIYKNFKRVAEVWMDEYKEYLYQRQPYVYQQTDPGDLTERKKLRENLKCKSFKWFMEEIAFDLVEKYPPVEPPDHANGTIRSLSNQTLCVEIDSDNLNRVFLGICSKSRSKDVIDQFFRLTQFLEIRLMGSESCWDVNGSNKDQPILLYDCHREGGNQLFDYDPVKKWIIHNRQCLDYKPDTLELVMNKCNRKNERMQWTFGDVNKKASQI